MDISRIDDFLRSITAKRLLSVGLLASVGLWIGYHFAFTSRAGQREVEAGGTRVSHGLPEASLAESTSVAVRGATSVSDTGEELEVQVRRARNIALRQTVDQAASSFQAWEKAASDWNRMKTELLDGDRGRSIATNQDGLPMVLELIRLAGVRSDELETYRVQLDEVSAAIEDRLTHNPGAEVTESTRQMLETLKEEVSQKGQELARVVNGLQRHAQAARGVAPGERTLRQAMDEQGLMEQQQMLALELAAREQARQETAARFLAVERQRQEAEAELRQSELNAEIERLKAERETTELTAARERAEHEAMAAREKLEAEFTRDRAEINKLLSPFVTPAPYRINPPFGYYPSGQNTGESLSAIAKCGALEESEDGLDAMSRLGENCPRPLGTFPIYVQSEWRRNPRVKAKLERAQELLRKYGELLVEKGILEK
jgi:hypothetical protein